MNFMGYAISPYLKIALLGFGGAVVGAVLGFSGVGAGIPWIPQLGFFVVLLGVLIGFIGIFLGWYKEGRPAIRNSRKAAKNIRDKMYKHSPDKDL